MTCPAGHASADPQWCDTCGLALAPGAAAPPPPLPCPVCGAARSGRFCDECGHDGARPVPWTAVVRADPDRLAEVRRRRGPDGADLALPADRPERSVALGGTRVAIGRRSRSRGTHPEIDLSPDPGVSAQHALLLARPDGGWEVVDVGSTNGTELGTAALTPHMPVPLAAGEPVRLGAWTVLVLQRG